MLVPVGSLYLCDYLFPGEAPAEALLSVRELLDLQITEGDVVCDVETPAGKKYISIFGPFKSYFMNRKILYLRSRRLLHTFVET